MKPAIDGFEAQTTKPATDDFEVKPSNLRHVSPPDLDRPSRQVVRAPRSASTLAILSWSTRSLHVSLRPSMSQVSATTACHPAIWSLDPSLTTALPRRSVTQHDTSTSALHLHGPSARHITTFALSPQPPVLGTASPHLVFTSPSASGSAARHLHNTTQETRRSTHRSVPVTNSRSNCTKK